MNFGERLRSLRNEREYSLRKMADELDISFSALGKYERNEHQPDFDTLEKIANYFDVSVDWLLGRTSSARTIYLNFVKPVFDAIKIMEEKNTNNLLTIDEKDLLLTLKNYINNEENDIYPEMADLANEYLKQNSNDIAWRLRVFQEELENSDGLSFDGEPLSEAAKETLLESMELIVKQTQRINKIQHSKDDE